jgi:hypothetical protein
LYYCTFSTAYNKCALQDAHAGHIHAAKTQQSRRLWFSAEDSPLLCLVAARYMAAETKLKFKSKKTILIP